MSPEEGVPLKSEPEPESVPEPEPVPEPEVVPEPEPVPEPVQSYWELVRGERGWIWFHSTTPGQYVPLGTAVLTAAVSIGFWVWPGSWTDQQAEGVSDDYAYPVSDATWYTVFTPIISHLDLTHVLSNLTIIVLAGVLLELTEGTLRFFCVVWASQVCAMGLHGGVSHNPAIGASGAAYGIMWGQLALLGLNWTEMLHRSLRLIIMVGLLIADVSMVTMGLQEGTAVGAHLGGAIGGSCAIAVLGVNVTWQRAEVWIIRAGLLGYITMCIVMFATAQLCAGAFALVLALLVCYNWRFLRPVSNHTDLYQVLAC